MMRKKQMGVIPVGGMPYLRLFAAIDSHHLALALDVDGGIYAAVDVHLKRHIIHTTSQMQTPCYHSFKQQTRSSYGTGAMIDAASEPGTFFAYCLLSSSLFISPCPSFLLSSNVMIFPLFSKVFFTMMLSPYFFVQSFPTFPSSAF